MLNLREGRTHQLIALFYNLAISILRANGWQSIAGVFNVGVGALAFYIGAGCSGMRHAQHPGY